MGSPITPVHFYRRYVDDTFCLFNNEHEALLFFEFLNSQHNNIRSTMEKETNNTLAFLDVFINNKDPNNLITSVYRKKTFTAPLLIFSASLPCVTNLDLLERY